MAEDSGLVEFKQGVALLRKGYSAEAVEYLQHAVELKQQNPYYLSFLGVSMARALQKGPAAVELCRKAIGMKRNEPQLYLNLAEVYMSAARRRDAVETLDAASRYCAADARIKQMRSKLGQRCLPVLPFLERSNPLNRSLGKLRQRLLERLGKSENSSTFSEVKAGYLGLTASPSATHCRDPHTRRLMRSKPGLRRSGGIRE